MSIVAPYFKIETFGAVDGPGVRLVIFLQGCPMRCLYCHNPESWTMNSNKSISVDEVIAIYSKNKTFYRNGGITLSGGEPLIHQAFCLGLAEICYKNKISLALDTSGVTFTKQNLSFFNKLSTFHPLWIVDIKQINPAKHLILTGIKAQNELKLIKFLEEKHEQYWMRQVLLRGYTDDKKDLTKLGLFIRKLKYLSNFEILPYHTLGVKKYQTLKIPYKLKGINDTTKIDVHNAKLLITTSRKK